MKVRFFVNGKELPVKAIEEWELRRSRHVARFLQSKLGLPKTDITQDANGPRDIASIRAELTKMKTSVDANKLRSMLKGRTAFSSFSTKIIDSLSLGKRKSSV